MTRYLMVQGTSSSAGKSSIVTAICRILSDKGVKVAPLKAQNMSSNVHITKEGLEMAKAQAVQAIAARTEPSVYMNPILLKPMGHYVSKVVLLGRAYRDMHAKYYYDNFVMKKAFKYVMRAIRELSEYDVVLIEGAGSPAEINMQEYDIANMKLAEMLDAPVIIVADIERGGCFASMVGTMDLLENKHKKLVKGFIINKFRGDKEILLPGITKVEKLIKKPVLGTIPFVDNMSLPNEDSLSLEPGKPLARKINVAIVKYPNAINLADFDIFLKSSNLINPIYAASAAAIRDADLIIFPASRNIDDDLAWLRENGFAELIKSLRSRKMIIGICEGFAMMAKKILLNRKKMGGLGLIDTNVYGSRRISGHANLKIVSRKPAVNGGERTIYAYLRAEYRTINGQNANRLFQVVEINGIKKKFAEGAISRDGLALGCNLYGLFESSTFRESIINCIARRRKISRKIGKLDTHAFWDGQIQNFSDIVKKNVDMDLILKLVKV